MSARGLDGADERRKKTSDRGLESFKKTLADVKVENASLWWSRVNFDGKVVTLQENVGSVLKAVAELAWQYVTQVLQSVDSAFSEHWKRLVEQARCTETQVAIVLKTSVNCSDADVHREDANCTDTF